MRASGPGRGCERLAWGAGLQTTPLWRNGPLGPKTLCNACGVRDGRRQSKVRANAPEAAANAIWSGESPARLCDTITTPHTLKELQV